ncbi:ketopantoate reductase family protein [bacterium]|nr:ketopantoate reductase family protein [bacterium]
MKILVFGAGAVGQAVGCILSAAGHSVDMIVRERYLQALRKEGLAVTGIFGDFRADPGHTGFHTSVDDIRNRAYDYCLITTKSNDTETAIYGLSQLLRQEFIAVSIQNGCGNFEKVIARFGEERSLAARVITGFEIEHPGLVRITVTADAIHIGGWREGYVPPQAILLADALNGAGLPAESTPYVRRDLFAKLLYNSALNPLGAILGVHYGALGDDTDTRAIMSAVIREVFAVIDAMGAVTHWSSAEEYESFFYAKQIPPTYHHRSSMLQDLETGKRTEIDALTGYVSAQGRLLDIPTPVCDTLTCLIKFREKFGKP